MRFIGTRNEQDAVAPSEAILKGICADGGLYVPERIPEIGDIQKLIPLSYQELAYEVMKEYFTDFSKDELQYCIHEAYSKFDTPDIAPVTKQGDCYFLELFHGRTLAFKDMALSILPYLMKTAAKKNKLDKEIVILTATSGDTGKAALEGFCNVPGIRIIVFYPVDGVSPVQKQMMVTQEGENTCVVGIQGNFDDAQSAVKQIFTDRALAEQLAERGYIFSSANSINIGRLAPQIVYYFYAYSQLVRMGACQCGEEVNFAVPTGNFGNILAGYYAKRMGLPVGKLLCASNDNKVLYDFFATGEYDRNREFFVTAAPSMDILVSSNLERFIYHMVGADKNNALMSAFSKTGRYEVLNRGEEIIGGFAKTEDALLAVKKLYEETGYVMDPHTAVAYAAYQVYRNHSHDQKKTVVVSTASPYKFTKDVLLAISGEAPDTLSASLEKMADLTKTAAPEPIIGIEQRVVCHYAVCRRDEIKAFVSAYLL